MKTWISPRRIAQFAGAILSFTALGLGAASAENLKFVTLETAPWASYENGQAIGAFPSIVREMAKRSGHDIEMSLRPFARINQDLERGDQDCTIILWNESRSNIVRKGEEVYLMPFGVVAKTGHKLQTFEDLKPLTVSMLRGLKLGAEFDNSTDVRKELDKSYQIGLRKMAHNRLEAIGGAIPTIFYMAEQEKYEALLGEYLVLKEIPIVLQCSRNSKRLDEMGDLNAALVEMRADGTLKRLLEENSYF